MGVAYDVLGFVVLLVANDVAAVVLLTLLSGEMERSGLVTVLHVDVGLAELNEQLSAIIVVGGDGNVQRREPL